MSTKPFDWRVHLKVHPAADLFPLMSEAELQALADDLKRTGKLQQSIVLAEDGRLLDGRNRLDALVLIGSLKAGKTGKGLTGLRFTAGGQHQMCCHVQPGDPYEAVLSFNLRRRHLTGEQKREVIAKVLKAKPEASNNSIAAQVKADDKTVASVRRDLESNSETPNKTERTEADGRKARGRKPGTPKPKQPVNERELRERARDIGCHLHVHRFRRGRKGYTLTNPNGDKEFVRDAEVIIQKLDAVEATTTVKTEPATPANAADIALDGFDAHVLELIRITNGQKPQLFTKTAVPLPVLGDLAYFIRELVNVRKPANEGADHDASASAEQRKADYAASEVADKDLNIPDYWRRTPDQAAS
jgi:hypothetical protein